MPSHRQLLRSRKRLWDLYRFPGFRPSPTVRGIFGDPHARIITLTRREKKRAAAAAGASTAPGTIASRGLSGICPAATAASTWNSTSDAWRAGSAAR